MESFSLLVVGFVTGVVVFVVAQWIAAQRGPKDALLFSVASDSPHRKTCQKDARLTWPTTRQGHHQGQGTPRHIAFIMDGNRRYGTKRFGHERRLDGHDEGGKKLSEVLQWCLEAGLREVTCFAFSTENWSRDAGEIDFIMQTFLGRSEEISRTARTKGICVKILATNAERLPMNVRSVLERLERDTLGFSNLTLNLAISYGARSELVMATQRLCRAAIKDGINPGEIDEDRLEANLLMASAPDILVRTSGERRISNFLLWQLAYTELVFLDTLWPDLKQSEFLRVIGDFESRQRRFGR
mmetsp:Transcript_18065/g.55301  ORF Transcript_18065/g.55301 Transcript_18065/m.55301 type:complete len:299 (+) Transcript_18065:89-985(+)